MRIGLCILFTNIALVSRGVLGTKQELGIVLNERVDWCRLFCVNACTNWSRRGFMF